MNEIGKSASNSFTKELALFFFAYRAFSQQEGFLADKYEIRRVHRRIIFFIGRKVGMTVNELLQVLEVSKQALNTPMKELLAKGLIELHQNDKDKRSKLVFLTDKGRELDQALNDIQIQKMKDYFTKAGDPDGLYWNKVMELYAKEIDLDFINSISETLE